MTKHVAPGQYAIISDVGYLFYNNNLTAHVVSTDLKVFPRAGDILAFDGEDLIIHRPTHLLGRAARQLKP